MKKKVFKNVWLRVAMIVAVVTTAFAGTAWAQESPTYSKTSTFGDGLSVDYECTLDVDGVTWEMATVHSKSPQVSATSNGISFAGQGNKYFSKVTFTTNYFADKNVKSVTLNVSPAGTVVASQEDVEIGVNNNVGEGGELSVVYTPNSIPTAFTITSITVVYEYATPHFNRSSGEFNHAFDLVLTTATPGATIYYTTDGTDPDYTSSAYSSAIRISETTTVKAVTYKGEEHSAIVEETFTKTDVELPSYTATLYVNGTPHVYEGIEEYAAIPTPETPEFMGYEFVGWTYAEIDGEIETAPEYVIDLEMGNADVTYYALYAQVTHHDNVTFTAAGTDQGITVSKFPVGKKDNDITITSNDGILVSVVVTYAADAGNNVIASVSEGAKLHNIQGSTQTITFSKPLSSVTLYKPNQQGISASQIVVTSVKYSNFCTNFDVPSVEVSITAAGWATYCSDVALDFEGTDITAYTVDWNGSALIYTPINQVPAGVGVVLKSNNGGEVTVEVPELYSAPALTVNNILEGTITGTTCQSTDYILNMVNGKIGFYTAGSYTSIRAKSAYLPASAVPGASGVKFFLIDPEDDATGINAVESAVEDGVIFNVAGQRLQKMQKGINIVNGKKILK